MTTAELVKRMEAMGWKMPRHLWINAYGTLGVQQTEDVGRLSCPIDDKPFRDLLAADFERWLIGKKISVYYSCKVDNSWWVRVGTIDSVNDDKLTALITSAEAALGKDHRWKRSASICRRMQSSL